METKYPTVSCSNTNVQKYGHLGTTIAKKAIVALMGTAVRRHPTIKDDQFNPFIIIEGSIIQDMTIQNQPSKSSSYLQENECLFSEFDRF